MKRFIAALALFGPVATACAQTLERAYVLAEPLQYSKDGKFRGCGIHLKLLQETQAQRRDYVTFSINFWIDNPSQVLLKTAWSKATIGGSGMLEPQKLESAWARLGTGDPVRPQRTMSGEDGSILAVMSTEPGIALLLDVLSGAQEVQVGFKPSGTKFERVFYGKATVEEETVSRVQLCLKELAAKIRAAEHSEPAR